MKMDVYYDDCAATLFPQLAWVAYKSGCCGDDPHARGATPEEAMDNLLEMYDEPMDWNFERREEARLDAMFEARYAGEDHE